VGGFVKRIGGLFGYAPDGKKLEPCPDSINCLKQESSKHMKEYSHPCPYSELCLDKEKEPHLTHEPHRVEQCPFKSSCQRLDDPDHRAKYRHRGYPDFLIPCPDGLKCRETSSKHRIKYSHGEHIQIVKDKSRTRSPSPPRAKPSPNYHEKVSYNTERTDQRIPCRHGSNCWDQIDSQHCSKFSHPHK
jgi:hypothetical protein